MTIPDPRNRNRFSVFRNLLRHRATWRWDSGTELGSVDLVGADFNTHPLENDSWRPVLGNFLYILFKIYDPGLNQNRKGFTLDKWEESLLHHKNYG